MIPGTAGEVGENHEIGHSESSLRNRHPGPCVLGTWSNERAPWNHQLDPVVVFGVVFTGLLSTLASANAEFTSLPRLPAARHQEIRVRDITRPLVRPLIRGIKMVEANEASVGLPCGTSPYPLTTITNHSAQSVQPRRWYPITLVLLPS